MKIERGIGEIAKGNSMGRGRDYKSYESDGTASQGNTLDRKWMQEAALRLELQLLTPPQTKLCNLYNYVNQA